MVICDAGSGIRMLGIDWVKREPRPSEMHLILSHTHFDHILGFPFFAPLFRKDITLYLHAPEGQEGSLRERLFGMLVPHYCPVSVQNLAANIIEVPFDHRAKLTNRVTLESMAQNHPGGSFGYALRNNGQRIVYATDSELDARLLNANSAELKPEDECRFAPEVLNFYRDADLVIADAQYTDEEYATRRGWGHPRFITVVDLAITARARRLALFHHDPRHSDADMDEILSQARRHATMRGAKVDIFAAVEGRGIEM